MDKQELYPKVSAKVQRSGGVFRIGECWISNIPTEVGDEERLRILTKAKDAASATMDALLEVTKDYNDKATGINGSAEPAHAVGKNIYNEAASHQVCPDCGAPLKSPNAKGYMNCVNAKWCNDTRQNIGCKGFVKV